MDRLETRGRTRRGRSGYGRRRALVNACLAVALAAMARPARAARARLLLFGDSLTAGYGLPAQDALPAQLQRALDARGVERFAAVFPAVAARHGAALMPFLLEGVAGRPELNQQDGIHPNREGVAAVVAGLVPHVRRLLAP